MKFIVEVKEGKLWLPNGDGPMSEKTALRVAAEIRKECGVLTRVRGFNKI